MRASIFIIVAMMSASSYAKSHDDIIGVCNQKLHMIKVLSNQRTMTINLLIARSNNRKWVVNYCKPLLSKRVIDDQLIKNKQDIERIRLLFKLPLRIKK